MDMFGKFDKFDEMARDLVLIVCLLVNHELEAYSLDWHDSLAYGLDWHDSL